MAFSKLAFLKRLSVIVFTRSQLPQRIGCSSSIKNCFRAVMWRLSNLKYRESNQEPTTWYLQLMNRWFPFQWPLLSELWSIQRTEENLSNNIRNLHQKPESCKWTAHCRERHHPVPVNVGNQWFHHEFRVLEKSEANCLSGLDFLERHKCEPLFSRSELKLDSPHSIPLYHKNFEIDKNAIFRVVATETIKVPAGHATILPAHIPNWKKLPFHLNAVFEPLGNFTLSGDISASNIPFDFSDKTIPVILTNKTDSEITIYKNTTLGSSEL